MPLAIKSSFAHKITLIAVLSSAMASVSLMGTFVVIDSSSTHLQLRSRLSTLANVVGQNSTAALKFDDRQAATEVLQALRAEPTIVVACLYDASGTLFAEYEGDRG